MAGSQAVEGAGRASSDSRRSQPAAAGPEPASRPRIGSQRAQQRPQRHPQGRRCHPQPAAAPRARHAARRRRRRPPKATACPLCPSPAALSRASPRPGARDARRGGRAALRRCCCCCPPLQPPPNQPTERRPICGSRRTSTLFLVTWRRTATAGGRAGRQWALAAHPDPHLSPPPHDHAPPHPGSSKRRPLRVGYARRPK